jgi:secondary thiamine-phosphate synthase enzyme
MGVISRKISLETKGNTDIIDITPQVAGLLSEAGLKSGIVNIFVPGATGAITTVEYESGLVEDLKNLFEAITPEKKSYAHNLKWGDGNGHSHLRAALLGPSLTVPFLEGKMQLGTWQQIVFIDFDNRPRSRVLSLQILGE